MSVSVFKNWFDRIDLSKADYRVRWALLTLPLLMCLLLALLMWVSYVNSRNYLELRTLQEDMRSLVSQAHVASSDRNVTDSADVAAPLGETAPAFQVAMTELHGKAMTLQGLLYQEEDTRELADRAAQLAALVSSVINQDEVVPDVSFWQNYSEWLANLEIAVAERIITKPEDSALVAELRESYARLRTIDVLAENASSTLTADAVDSTVVPALQSDTEFNQKIEDNIASSKALQLSASRLQFLATVLAVPSVILMGVLLLGLRRARKNSMADNELKERREQDAILQLLDEITPLADGDLSVHATVTDASTGAVADAFNFAIAELRRLVVAVIQSADNVNSAVAETEESAKRLAKSGAVQTREIHRSSNYLNAMSDTMAQLSAHAVESTRIAETSVKQAQLGSLAMRENADGLMRIGDQADMTSRLMQRLLESSESINEHVEQIRSVAKRTDLLALNTTIHAAAAVGGGSTVTLSQLSDEVAHLADALSRTTRDIAGLTEIIQQDAALAMQSMEQTTRELNNGQGKAQQASVCLEAIEKVSHELNELIGDIASKSLLQAGVVRQLSGNMKVIHDISLESSHGMRNSVQSLEHLQQITNELHVSVADFKVPNNDSSWGEFAVPAVKKPTVALQSADVVVEHG